MSSGKVDNRFPTEVPLPITTPAPAPLPGATPSLWAVHADVAEHGSNNTEDEHTGISQNKSFNWNYIRDNLQTACYFFFGLKCGQESCCFNWRISELIT